MNSSSNPQAGQKLIFKNQKATDNISFDSSWVLAVGAKNTPGGGTISITCNISPQPVSGRIYYELNVNGTAYELYNNSIIISTQPSTTYSIYATAYYYTSLGETLVASASTSIKTTADVGTGNNPGCPKNAPLILFPLDTSTVANRAGWAYIQYDWVPAPGTTTKTPGTVQLRYRISGSNTWSYGQAFLYSYGGTNPNHFFITNLIPGQSYQVQLGSDCNSGSGVVEADFTNNIYSITAGPQ